MKIVDRAKYFCLFVKSYYLCINFKTFIYMKFVTSSTELLANLQVCNRVVSSKHTLPILDNILFVLEDNNLVLRAADLENTIIAQMTVEGKENGSIAIPAKLIIDTLLNTPEQPVIFTIDTNTCSITLQTENGRFNIVGADADDFPLPRAITETEYSMEMSIMDILSVFKTILSAAADDDLRPIMNGICFDKREGINYFVATDSHRLVQYQLLSGIDNQSEKDYKFVLHKKAAGILKSMLSKKDGLISIKVDSKTAVFEVDNFTFISTLVEGVYPNYASVIPKTATKRAIINTIDYINAIKPVSNYSNQASNLLKLNFKSDLLTIIAQDIDYSISAETRLACEFEGEDFEIGFKSTFLMELLTNISEVDKESVVCQFTEAGRAAIFEPLTQPEDKNILMLLMPMMLG